MALAKFSMNQLVRVPVDNQAEPSLRGFEGTATFVSVPTDSTPVPEHSYIVRFDNREIQLGMIRESELEKV